MPQHQAVFKDDASSATSENGQTPRRHAGMEYRRWGQAPFDIKKKKEPQPFGRGSFLLYSKKAYLAMTRAISRTLFE